MFSHVMLGATDIEKSKILTKEINEVTKKLSDRED